MYLLRREGGSESKGEGGVGELKSSHGEPGRVGASAREQGLVGHLSEGQPEGKSGDRKSSRAMKFAGQRASELRVGDWIRGGHIYRAGEGGGVEDEQDGAEGIRERDPAHPLPAGSELSAEAKTEDGDHPRQGSLTGSTENRSEAEVDDPDACVDGRLGRGLPLLAEIGKKA